MGEGAILKRRTVKQQSGASKINPRFGENQSVICPSRSVILVKSGVIL